MLKSIITIICVIFFSNVGLAKEYWQVSNSDIKKLNSALYYADRNKWPEALRCINNSNDKILKSIIHWLKYRSDQASFSELSQFVDQHPNWPEQLILISKLEHSLNENFEPNSILNWFTKHPPITDNGIKYIALAKQRLSGNTQEVKELLRKAWRKSDFTPLEEADFLKRYGSSLTQKDHIERIDELLWERKISQARRSLGKVSNDYQKLFNARIELIQNIGTIKAALNMVPANLRQDPGLNYEAAHNYFKQQEFDKVQQILLHMKQPASYQPKWWILKNRQVRELIQEKKYKAAYQLVSLHNNFDSADFAEAEWLAGWLSLRFKNDHEAAYRHFYNLYKKVKSPISLARGAYWSARANDNHNKELAYDWYRIAAKHVDTFYGQLALHKLKHEHLKLPDSIKPTPQEINKYKSNDLLKVAYIFNRIGKVALAKVFIKTAIENASTSGETLLISQLNNHFNNIHLKVESTKHAARLKNVFTKAAYPTIDRIAPSPIELPLTHAIIRQESVFDQYAESSAGATGLMQLMPAGAKELAKEMNIRLNTKHLKTNPKLNIKLGSYYLSKLIQNYNGSYVLAIAAYNAGPGNVKKWLESLGDPRTHNNIEDVIDWIELIPYYETRNYVQRVLENLQIYRTIIHTSKAKLMLEQDLKK